MTYWNKFVKFVRRYWHRFYTFVLVRWQRFLQWAIRKYLLRWSGLPLEVQGPKAAAAFMAQELVGFCDNDGVPITVPTLRQHDGRLLCSTCKKRQKAV